MNKKVVFLPYDMDTAIGINNEGSLVFGYNLEDTDLVGGISEVFNGQSSVLWCNLRDTFGAEIKTMYQNLRASGNFSYEKVEAAFEAHQEKWPEAIFNEDAYVKYIMPLIEEGDETYLSMLLGSKAEQRKWWLYNRFRYMDSKYNSGDSLSDRMIIRGNAKANIVLTPYADIYASIRWGSTLQQTRAQRNVACTMVNPLDSLGDTDIYIYSAGQMAGIGDLSGLMVSFADFHSGTHLQSIIIGNSDPNYSNTLLRSLNIGNLRLLKKVDARNCVGLGTANENYAAQKNVDLSGCSGIEEIYFDGTNIGSVTLPNGGFVKKLHLPGTITNLTIRNQQQINEFVCPDFSHITTLNLENSLTYAQISSIVDNIATGCRVRLFNYRWDFNNIAAVHTFLDKFENMTGIDQNGDNAAAPQLFITVHVPTATGDEIDSVLARYPDIVVDADVATYYLRYYDYEGENLLYTETVAKGQNGTYNGTPAKSSTAQYTYTFAGWNSRRNSSSAESGCRDNIQGNTNVYAAYTTTIRTYTITFVRGVNDGGGTLQTSQVAYGQMPVYSGATPTSTQEGEHPFQGWTPPLASVTGDQTYTARFAGANGITRETITRMISSIENDEITEIGECAFAYALQLSYVSCQSVETVAYRAFMSCSRLKSVTLPNVTTVSDRAFYACISLTSVNFPSLTSAGSYAFGGCQSLNTFIAPNLSIISGSIFQNCYWLVDLSLSSALSYIPTEAFGKCEHLSYISFPNVTSIGYYAFQQCKELQSISLPNVVSIDTGAFGYCSKLGPTLLLPELQVVGSSAFYGCSSLELVSLPKVKSIFNNAFTACWSLTTLVLPNTSVMAYLYNSSALYNTAITSIYVADNLVASYQSAAHWSYFSSMIKGLSEFTV